MPDASTQKAFGSTERGLSYKNVLMSFYIQILMTNMPNSFAVKIKANSFLTKKRIINELYLRNFIHLVTFICTDVSDYNIHNDFFFYIERYAPYTVDLQCIKKSVAMNIMITYSISAQTNATKSIKSRT